MKRIVLAGAGGHAKVVADLAELNGFEVVGATDPSPRGRAARASGLRILGRDARLRGLRTRGIQAAVGVGSIKDTSVRRKVRLSIEKAGLRMPALVHPSAVVASSARLGAGCQVMANAAVNPGTSFGKNCVVNTGAVVEHDCRVGADAFIGPGARIGGDVRVGAGAFVGMGSVVLQCVRIGARAVVGAGAVVVRDVPAGAVVVGAPARPVRRR